MTLRRTTQQDYERRILRAQQLLEHRLDEAITPAELAKAAAFSLHHFHRIFRAQLGETVMQHVRRLRLERAARRLRSSDERILTLALEAGYDSHEAFTRAFADRFGLTPSEYRELPSPRVVEHARSSAGPMARVTVETFPRVRLLSLRHRGGYGGVEAVWERVRAWGEPRGLRALYGLCPDDPDVTATEQLRFDAGVAVDDLCEPGWAVSWVPAGTYAVGLHVGPFHRLSETYLDVIGRWLPSSGYEPTADPVVEHYLDDPRTTPEGELRTEVRVRLMDA
jgi:AraC family transcriptional regulator